jgi:hypothetical protein
MIAKFFNLIGQLVMWSLVVLLSGVLYVGGYFYVKSGEPMTVAEAQRRAPGITFRDFWSSRVEQWRAHDVKFAEVKDRQGGCEPLGTAFTAWRTVKAVPFVIQTRLAIQEEDYDQWNKANKNLLPSKELLYDGPFLDAAWEFFEAGSWWQFANRYSPHCPLTYPTPADVSANRDAAGALP